MEMNIQSLNMKQDVELYEFWKPLRYISAEDSSDSTSGRGKLPEGLHGSTGGDHRSE